MLQLAIDTSSLKTGLALAAENTLELRRFGGDLKAGSHLLPAIDRMLAEHGRSLDDLDMITLVIGPGSFTGLRIGLATAKGIALSRDLPLVPVGALEVLARQAMLPKGRIFPVLSARRDEVYSEEWLAEAGEVRKLGQAGRFEFEDFARKLPDDGLVLGPAALKLRAGLGPDSSLSCPCIETELSLETLLQLGRQAFEAGRTTTAAALEPDYLQAFQPTEGRKRV